MSFNKEFLPTSKLKFICNKYRYSYVSNDIIDELRHCQTFCFSVAFITMDGFSLLLKTLDDLNQKGIRGTIITADYLHFNDPVIFRKLISIPNIEVRCFKNKHHSNVNNNFNNFHPKGYIFKNQNSEYSVIIGSSNLTNLALQTNVEWNIKLIGKETDEVIKNILIEFNDQLENSFLITNDWINEYEKIWNEKNINQEITNIDVKKETFSPNEMQLEALQSLQKIRSENKNKAIIISATGSGKTYLSVFDAYNFKPHRLLFVAHREQLLKSAQNSFKFVFKDMKSYGLLSGNSKETNKDFIFATVQTLIDDNWLNKFDPETFDYIVIDEAHHSASNSHSKIINYFKPKFLLGLTATPYRMDGKDIFEYFDHNIAYEITLQKALEQNLLSPFRYFGISDKYYVKENDFSIERVKYIYNKLQYYGACNNVVAGLIFVSNVTAAKLLQAKLNYLGLKTYALSGNDSQFIREEKIKLLELHQLDYIITCDIFNEGVDLPFINQIVLLRETKSITIFVQQLGRGLRKFSEKSYLTVIDFVANYNNNYLIPMALTSDNSYNADQVIKKMNDIEHFFPNYSIEFDEITKRTIFNSINKFCEKRIMSKFKSDFEKSLLINGRFLNHLDFIKSNFIDLLALKKENITYLDFLIKENQIKLSDVGFEQGLKTLNYFFNEFLDAKFIEPIILLKQKLNNELIDSANFKSSTISLLSNTFLNDNSKYYSIINNNLTWSSNMEKLLQNNNFMYWFNDLLNSTEYLFDTKYKNKIDSFGFKLYEKYTRKDVCKILGFTKNVDSTMYGYFKHNNINLLFVTLDKSENMINYNDELVADNLIKWESRKNVSLDSKMMSALQNIQNKNLVFVKRNKAIDNSLFYYLGEFNFEFVKEVGEDKNKQVQGNLILTNNIPKDWFDFLTSF